MVIEYDETTKKQSKGFFLKKGENYYTVKFPSQLSKLKRHPTYRHWLKKKMEEFEKEGYIVLNRNL